MLFWLSHPLCYALRRAETASKGLLYLCPGHFLKRCELRIKSWHCGSDSTPATAILCGRGQLPRSHVHTFPQTWLPLLSYQKKIENTASDILLSSFPHPHTRLKSSTAFSFPLRSAGEHRLLRSTTYSALASEVVSCSYLLAGVWQRAREEGKQCCSSEMRHRKHCMPAALA